MYGGIPSQLGYYRRRRGETKLIIHLGNPFNKLLALLLFPSLGGEGGRKWHACQKRTGGRGGGGGGGLEQNK